MKKLTDFKGPGFNFSFVDERSHHNCIINRSGLQFAKGAPQGIYTQPEGHFSPLFSKRMTSSVRSA